MYSNNADDVIQCCYVQANGEHGRSDGRTLSDADSKPDGSCSVVSGKMPLGTRGRGQVRGRGRGGARGQSTGSRRSTGGRRRGRGRPSGGEERFAEGASEGVGDADAFGLEAIERRVSRTRRKVDYGGMDGDPD